jgi:hypothetical protein
VLYRGRGGKREGEGRVEREKREQECGEGKEKEEWREGKSVGRGGEGREE